MIGNRRTVSWIGLALMIAGGTGVGQGAWIQGKAELAQILLESAWTRAENGSARPAPWPWADTWPVARLQAPEKGVDLIVLAGATGASLAFGPGHLDGTARPGSSGHSIIAGHRDTHFKFLRYLKVGEELTLTTPLGRRSAFRIERVWIADASEASVFESGPGQTMTLVTCFPFDAIDPGGSLRYLVRARLVPDVLEGRGGTFFRLARSRL